MTTNKAALLAIYEHNIDLQKKAEQCIQAEYAEGTYTIEQPYIRLNPYLIAPLTALIMFETENETSVQVTVKGIDAGSNIVLQFPKEKQHVLEIIGLYGGRENNLTIVTEDGKETSVSVTTEALPANIARPAITTDSASMDIWDGTLLFAIPTNPETFTAAYDCNGDCRWYTNQKFAYTLKRGNNGRILVGAPKLLAIPYSPTSMYEMSLSGKIYREFRLPRGYHHNYFEVDDKHILFLTQNIELGTSGDLIALFNTETGEVEKEWDIKNMLPQDVAGSGSQDMHDWFHANSVWYDKASDSITVSGRHQDIIVNFNAATETINWMLGDADQWPEEMVNQYFLKADGELEWAYEPHAVHFIGDNLLLCFDSGHYRAKQESAYVAPENNYSRAVIYQINPEAGTVKQVWQYGKELGAAFYSTYMGNVSVYGKDYYGIHSGGSALVDGKPIDMPGIFRKDFDSSCELYATTHEVRNGKCICSVTCPTNTYQMERVAIQHPDDVHSWNAGEIIGEYAATEEFPMDYPEESAGFMPASYNLNFGYDGDRLFIRGDFLTDQMVMLKMEGEQDIHSFYIQTTRRPFYTMCPVTWRPGNGRPVEWPINVKGFHDIYRLKVLINENIYETGIVLDLRGGNE